MRSKLFVPGSRPELFAKALTSAADAISFDLEDSVPEECKAQAREAVASLLRTSALREVAKLILVRSNAPRSAAFEADAFAVAQPNLALLNLPKVETPADIAAAVRVLERAEAANGVHEPIGLLINIETPKALRCAAELAAAHPRVVGLQLGLADLFEPAGIDRHDSASVHAAMLAVRLAAAEAGVFAYDAAFADLRDDDGFRTEAEMAHRLGYLGKSCIHPSQIATANAVFRPSEAELAQARRIVDAAQHARSQGRGAIVVDGRMIDLPFLKRAQALLAVYAS
jgi:citrate lyase subunit beta/citryl-CoA lyase